MCSARFLWETGNPQHRQSTEEISVNKVVVHSLIALTRSQSTSLNGPACALLPLLSYAIVCFSFLWWLQLNSQSQWLLPPSGAFTVVHQWVQTARKTATLPQLGFPVPVLLVCMGVFTNNILGLDIPVKQKTKKETKLLVNGSLFNYVL